jgi:hypothetical protein
MNCCDFGIGSQTPYNHKARYHPHTTRSHLGGGGICEAHGRLRTRGVCHAFVKVRRCVGTVSGCHAPYLVKGEGGAPDVSA